MLGVSESHQNYHNGAVSEQLLGVGSGRGSVLGVTENMLINNNLRTV
jgi:hypothetical protein